MLSFVTASILLGAVAVSAQTVSVPFTSTNAAVVAAEQTIVPNVPISHVKGKVFDRFVTIMMENQDFALGASDPNYQKLAALGITLTNYYGITHPSEPNYCASYGGDNFGLDSDQFSQIPANVSNIWDLLADKGISFSSYMENLPYTGFQGLQYLDPQSGANNYVRKHNPPVLFNSNADRFDNIQDFDAFHRDLDNNQLSQHMFITPNELNDAHDTDIMFGGDFLFTFVEPLLDNPAFMKNTLLLLNFDESGNDTHANNVFTILISDAMPKELIGTTDDTVYTHYSGLATVEANWDLDTLGRWDVGANVFKWVADITGDEIRQPEVPVGEFFFNSSYAGAFSLSHLAPMPVPNTTMVRNGRKVFKDVVAQWGGLQECTYYEDVVLAADGMRPPKAIPASCATLLPSPLSATGTGSSTSSFPTTTVPSNSSVIISTPTATSSPVVSFTTSTGRTTETITSGSTVVTVTVDMFTTVCPVTESATTATGAASSPNAPAGGETSAAGSPGGVATVPNGAGAGETGAGVGASSPTGVVPSNPSETGGTVPFTGGASAMVSNWSALALLVMGIAALL